MPESRENAPQSRPAGYLEILLPVLVIVVGLLSTLVIGRLSREKVTEAAKAYFDLQSERVRQTVLERFSRYETALRGGQSLFAASTDVTLEEWERFSANLQVTQQLPGLTSVGFAPLVERKDE